jgi:hypothetical protein
MGNLSYPERLNVLHALSLEKERLVADVVLLHRCMHGKSDYKLSDIGVALSNNNERSGKVRLEQRQHALYISRSLFPHRAVREWNALPSDISTRPTLCSFKSKLYSYLLSV